VSDVKTIRILMNQINQKYLISIVLVDLTVNERF